MKNKIQNDIQKIAIQRFAMLIIVASTISYGAVQQPAAAYVSDPATVARLQNSRKDLLIRESRILRDQDDLNRQIWDLKRQNDPTIQPVLDELSSKLDQKYDQLRKTRWELRQVEQILL